MLLSFTSAVYLNTFHHGDNSTYIGGAGLPESKRPMCRGPPVRSSLPYGFWHHSRTHVRSDFSTGNFPQVITQPSYIPNQFNLYLTFPVISVIQILSYLFNHYRNWSDI
jgi:hypothetical protein